MAAHIFHLNDFGAASPYTGIMQAVIAGIAPDVHQHIISQNIQPYNIRQGAFQLYATASYLRNQHILIAVVDPGVGSIRRAIACRFEHYIILCPDNGLLSLLLEKSLPLECVELSNSHYHLPLVSTTFHGRDIFAPAAAHIALGTPLSELGNAISLDSLLRLPHPQARQIAEGSWQTDILDVDSFGNIITSLHIQKVGIQPQDYPSWWVQIGDILIPQLSRTYTDTDALSYVAYVGSSGFLEIALREGNAFQALGCPASVAIFLIQR